MVAPPDRPTTTPHRTAAPKPPQLPAQTVAWLATHPHARRVIRSVWDTLTELEQAGHHPHLIAALRSVLTRHHPTEQADATPAAASLGTACGAAKLFPVRCGTRSATN